MKAKLSCPVCRHYPLNAVADTDGLPKELRCSQCNWTETDVGRCKTFARHQIQVQTALLDPAERKRRQDEHRKRNNQSVLRSYRIKHT